MNRTWPVRILWVLVMVALYFAVDRGYIGWRITLLVFAAGMIVFVIRKRRGELPPYPAYLRALPLRKIILTGVGLILASFAWLIFGFIFFDLQNARNGYTIMIPFAVLLVAGLAMAGGGLGVKLGRLMWDRL